VRFTDVDECATGSAGCDSDAECANTDGSFACECNDGFEDNGEGGCAGEGWLFVAGVLSLETWKLAYVQGVERGLSGLGFTVVICLLKVGKNARKMRQEMR